MPDGASTPLSKVDIAVISSERIRSSPYSFPCHAANSVVNNNGLEATNKVLKDDVTQRQLLPVMTFFTEIMKWLRSQSERRNPESVNYVLFATAHTFKNTEFIEAWRWLKDKNKQTWITHDVA